MNHINHEYPKKGRRDGRSL